MNKQITAILNNIAKIKAHVEDPALKATMLAEQEHALKEATGFKTLQGSLQLEVGGTPPPPGPGKAKAT